MEKKTFTLSKMTKDRLPRLPFLNIKEAILGKQFKLSVVIIGEAYSMTLNKWYRKKNKPANILTFRFEKNEGEIFLAPRVIKRDIDRFCESYKKLFTRIFIHGLLHLKGLPHNSTMEREEARWLKKFSS